MMNIVLLIAAIPIGYIAAKLIKLLIIIFKTFKSFPNIPQPNPLYTFPVLDQFSPDGIKRMLKAHISPEGNLLHPITHYGPHFDGKPTIFVADAEQFGELFKVEKFPKLDWVYDSFSIVLGNGLVLSNGELWKRQRRNLTPLFHFKSLTKMPPIMNNRVLEFVNEMNATNQKLVHPTHEFSRLTLRIVIDCVFGGSEYLDANVLSEHWETINKALNAYFLCSMLLSSKVNNSLPLPFNITIKKTMQKIIHLVKVAIEKKRVELQQDGERTGDLLESLLLIRDEQTGEPIPESLIVDEALTFLFAGHDTTSSVLSWAMTFISRDHTIAKKIREEVANVAGDRPIEYSDIKDLHYCNMVIRETLRMRPPVHTLDRRSIYDCEISGQKIPANTYVYPLLIAAHYDNRFWNDPWKFHPERFSEKEGLARNPYAFVPFSANTRNCIGQKFAILEGTLVLASVISKFDVLPADPKSTTDDDKWVIFGTMKPVDFQCSFVPISA